MRSGSDSSRGLYEKFTVQRTDGSSREGGRHHRCRYYVLDIDHDEFIAPALAAYAEACAEKFPLLAADLRKIVDAAREVKP